MWDIEKKIVLDWIAIQAQKDFLWKQYVLFIQGKVNKRPSQ